MTDLSIGENEVLKYPTINMWGLMCDLRFSNVLLQMLMPLYLGDRCSDLRLYLDGIFL